LSAGTSPAKLEVGQRHSLTPLAGGGVAEQPACYEPLEQARRIVHEALMKARALESDTLAKCEKMLAEAREEANQIKATLRQQGLVEGRQEGERQATAQAKALQDELVRVRKQLGEEFSKMRSELEPLVAELTLESLRLLLAGELGQNEALLKANLERVLDELKGQVERKLFVNLEQMDLARELLAQSCENLDSPELVGIESLEAGAVIGESTAGRIEAAPSEQLRALAQVFTGQEGASESSPAR